MPIEDLKGLHKRQPVLAFILAVGLFALAGIPPFVGFMGKFMLLTGALKAGGTENLIYLIVVILAAINTGIAIYYYLSVVRTAYTTDPEDRPDVTVDGLNKAIGIVLVVLIIIMGATAGKNSGHSRHGGQKHHVIHSIRGWRLDLPFPGRHQCLHGLHCWFLAGFLSGLLFYLIPGFI